VTWVWGLWDAELIDVDSLEWELSGTLTFGNISVVFSKVTFLHSLVVFSGSGVVFVVGRLRDLGVGAAVFGFSWFGFVGVGVG
jgi:hypothetical protein